MVVIVCVCIFGDSGTVPPVLLVFTGESPTLNALEGDTPYWPDLSGWGGSLHQYKCRSEQVRVHQRHPLVGNTGWTTLRGHTLGHSVHTCSVTAANAYISQWTTHIKQCL